MASTAKNRSATSYSRKSVAIGTAAVEALEPRRLLSAVPIARVMREPTATPGMWPFLHRHGANPASSGTASPFGYSPSQISHAYGFDAINLGITADGSGQTIAIVDAFNNPHLTGDLGVFDSYFGLPAASLQVRNQNGGTTPAADAPIDDGWGAEEALDVEWAHALAPKAQIVLVEAASDNLSDLFAAAAEAKTLGATVVSMSWSALAHESPSYATYDSIFQSTSGGVGVTFVSIAGDAGSPANYPGSSPNVVGVGGTSLSLDLTSGNRISETVWNDASGKTGGGPSTFETIPAYQNGIVTGTGGMRGTPDVAFDASPNTGVPIYDSYDFTGAGSWAEFGGTSFSAPAWAALIAIVDQDRARVGLNSLDGRNDTLPGLYSLPASDFTDITSGTNGTYSASAGYDLTTGRGVPIANRIVSDLASYVSNGTLTISGTAASDNIQLSSSAGIITATVNGQSMTYSSASIV